jgi:serine/threonine-protein kinase HipA
LKCKICLIDVPEKQRNFGYHDKCLYKLFGSVSVSPELGFSRRDFFTAAPKKTKGMSISGVQNKAQLHVEKNKLELIDSAGTHILKPSPEEYPFAAENEHLSMEIVRALGIPTPPCGLLAFNGSSNNSSTEYAYVIKRFDRNENHTPIHQEDMMQAMNFPNTSSESKYQSASYYDVLSTLKDLGGAPLQIQFFKPLVISYLICNEDYHLKNISLLHTNPVKLTPAYDFLNTVIHTKSGTSMALSFYQDKQPKYFATMANGYYSKQDFLGLALDANLPISAAKLAIKKILDKTDIIFELIKASYLPQEMKDEYIETVNQRIAFLGE